MVELSALDEERFGVRTAKARVTTPDDVAAASEFCQRESVRLLIARCPAHCWPAAHALGNAGASLMDVLVYYARDLQETPIPEDPGHITIRAGSTADADTLASMARAAFHDYANHYHADPRLDRAACDEVYVSWARRSAVSEDAAHAVFIAEEDATAVGFITLKRNNREEGEIRLTAVIPPAQGRGINPALMIRALRWCREQGCHRAVVSTQVTNIASQKVWTRLGFEPSHSFLTFHRWFDA